MALNAGLLAVPARAVPEVSMKFPVYQHSVGLGETVGLVERWLHDDDLQAGAPRLAAGGTFVLHLGAQESYCGGSGPCVHALHKDDILDCAGPSSSAPWPRMRPRFKEWALRHGFVVEDDVADRAAGFVASLFGAASESSRPVAFDGDLLVEHHGETVPVIEAIRRLLDPYSGVLPGGAAALNTLAERLADVAKRARPVRMA